MDLANQKSHAKVNGEKNLVTGRKGLARNIRALEELPKKDRLDIVKRGVVFVVYHWDGELHFGPARWLGYGKGRKSNDRAIIAANRINNIFGVEGPEKSDKLEKALTAYCKALGGKPVREQHKFWKKDCIKKIDAMLEQLDY